MGRQVSDIWEEFNAPLKRFIRRHAKDEHSAEDILQDVFLKIHSRIHTLKESSKLKSWMYQITRNAIIDHVRSHARKDNLKRIGYLPTQSVDSSASEEMDNCIRELIDRLPDLHRRPLLMTTFQNMAQKEIAMKLGISPSGAKSRIQRARKKLRDLLIEHCHLELESIGISIRRQHYCTRCCRER